MPLADFLQRVGVEVVKLGTDEVRERRKRKIERDHLEQVRELETGYRESQLDALEQLGGGGGATTARSAAPTRPSTTQATDTEPLSPECPICAELRDYIQDLPADDRDQGMEELGRFEVIAGQSGETDEDLDVLADWVDQHTEVLAEAFREVMEDSSTIDAGL